MQNVSTWSMPFVCALVCLSGLGCGSPMMLDGGAPRPASDEGSAIVEQESALRLSWLWPPSRNYDSCSSVAGADVEPSGSPLTAADVADSQPRFLRYVLDLGAAGIQPELLSNAAQGALTGPEAEHVRDAYAVDILEACSGARLVGLGDELSYLDEDGAHVELALRFRGVLASAIVVASQLPFDGPNPKYSDLLLRTTLEEARAAEDNMPSAFHKTLVVIFTDSETADLLEDAYAALPAEVRGDSIVLVVESLGQTVGLFHQSV